MIFYSLPPPNVFYKYIFINCNKPNNGIYYLRKWGRKVEYVIIDSGIEMFRNPKIKDYPKGHINFMVYIHNKVKGLCPNAEIWITCPDYCDDYHPKNLWISEKITNIERTVNNVIMCFEKYKDLNWLIPIQGHHRKPMTLARCIKYYDELGIDGDYYAIANICIEKKIKVMDDSIKLVKLLLPSKRIHAFGIPLNVAIKNKNLLYSFDSSAWIFPREPHKSVRGDAKHFYDYISKLKI